VGAWVGTTAYHQAIWGGVRGRMHFSRICKSKKHGSFLPMIIFHEILGFYPCTIPESFGLIIFIFQSSSQFAICVSFRFLWISTADLFVILFQV